MGRRERNFFKASRTISEGEINQPTVARIQRVANPAQGGGVTTSNPACHTDADHHEYARKYNEGALYLYDSCGGLQ